MGDAMLTNLTRERDQKVSLVKNYADTAAEEARDLSESEQETIGNARSRIGELDAQIELLAGDLEMADETRQKLRMIDPAQLGSKQHYRHSGELMHDLLHLADPEHPAASERWARAAKHARAAEHMGYDKANTTATAGGLDGLHIAPVVGPVIDPYPSGMPFASAIGLALSPNALHFMRPQIVDPNFATGVAEQAKEKAELVSKAFDVTAAPIALKTVGGYLNISQQLISLDPGGLSLIINHMNKRLGAAIDRELLTVVSASSAKEILAVDADAATVLKALFAASAKVYTATGELAQWVAMGPLGWARLGGLSDLAGRPMFPYLGANNADGQAAASTFAMTGPAGLRPIVTPAITDADFWVGNGDSIEGYIYRYPLLSAIEPSVLGRQIAVAASIAGHSAVADSAVHLTAS